MFETKISTFPPRRIGETVEIGG